APSNTTAPALRMQTEIPRRGADGASDRPRSPAGRLDRSLLLLLPSALPTFRSESHASGRRSPAACPDVAPAHAQIPHIGAGARRRCVPIFLFPTPLSTSAPCQAQ